MTICAVCDQSAPASDYMCRVCRLTADDALCEYCCKEAKDKGTGRFSGLCHKCRELAGKTANFLDPKATVECPECLHAFDVDENQVTLC